MKIRISRGVGSSPKMWACTLGRDSTQVGEFDTSDSPGWRDGTAMGGMSGIVWAPEGVGVRTSSGVLPRKLYSSVDQWVADIAAEYPQAAIIRHDDQPQHWL
jgi:hypothetical protein